MSSWNAADLVIYIGVQTIRCPPTKYVSLLYYFTIYSLWQKCTPDKILSHLHVLLIVIFTTILYKVGVF